MDFSWVNVLLCVFLNSKSVMCGHTYLEEFSVIPLTSILKKIPNTTYMQCILRCKRSRGCKRAAMQEERDCLLLDDENIHAGSHCGVVVSCKSVQATLYEQFESRGEDAEFDIGNGSK